MPVLPNSRHELFAQAIADGKTQVEAHEVAGYKPHRSTASQLAHDPNISARVSEVLAERAAGIMQATERAIGAMAVTKEWIIQQLLENARLAREAGDFVPANRAVELVGKELGMFIDNVKVRSESVVTHKSDDVSETARWIEEVSTSRATPALPLPLPN